MNRNACLVLTSLFLSLPFAGPSAAQPRSSTVQEKIVRETYRKLENYNAAAQVFQNDLNRKPIRSEATLSFELSDFRFGKIDTILNQRYAELVTLPTGDVVSLTRGGHSLDGGPQEATYAAAWERGQYAAVFDPIWTVADVFHFEAARYYDIRTYVTYQVTVRLEGRSRTYRAVALFHDGERVPEFWDAIVNGLGNVWEEKRPPYKAKTTLSTTDAYAAIISGDGGGEMSAAGSTSTSLPFWLSGDTSSMLRGGTPAPQNTLASARFCREACNVVPSMSVILRPLIQARWTRSHLSFLTLVQRIRKRRAVLGLRAAVCHVPPLLAWLFHPVCWERVVVELPPSP